MHPNVAEVRDRGDSEEKGLTESSGPSKLSIEIDYGKLSNFFTFTRPWPYVESAPFFSFVDVAKLP